MAGFAGEVKPAKDSLRIRMKALIAALEPAERAAASGRILSALRAIVPSSGRVLAYEPLRDEPDISPLVEELRAAGRLALVVGRGEEARIDPAGGIVLAIVPGRAFTPAGDRLGRGGGTFDRILAPLACPRIGVAFACQVIASIPTDPHDVRVDRVIVG